MERWFAMKWERTAEVASAASPERIWAALLDGRRWSFWNPGVEWMTLEGPLRAGTLVTLKPKGAPQTAFRIEAVEEGRRLVLLVTFGPVAALRLGWELIPRGDRTELAQRVAIEGPLAGVLLRRAAERIAGGMAANLERLAARASEK
jgi:uncharacterized protein YndB with AHSA1/START domain